MPKKWIEPLLIEAAISLYGEFGFEGVTTRALASRAGVMEYNIYRLFKTKERLYGKVLRLVVDRSIDAMADFDRNYSKRPDKKDDPASLVHAAVNHWYSSLPRDGAKMLQHALMSDPRNAERAWTPMENIVSIITKSIGGAQKKAKPSFDPKTRAEALIRLLFQVKVSYKGSLHNEMKEVNRFLDDWIREVLPAASSRRT